MWRTQISYFLVMKYSGEHMLWWHSEQIVFSSSLLKIMYICRFLWYCSLKLKKNLVWLDKIILKTFSYYFLSTFSDHLLISHTHHKSATVNNANVIFSPKLSVSGCFYLDPSFMVELITFAYATPKLTLQCYFLVSLGQISVWSYTCRKISWEVCLLI